MAGSFLVIKFILFMTALENYFALIDILFLFLNYLAALQFAFLNIAIVDTFAIYHYFTFNFINQTLDKLSRTCTRINHLILQNDKFKTKLKRIELKQMWLIKKIYLLHFYFLFAYQYTFTKLWCYGIFAFIIGSLPCHVICVLSLKREILIEYRILIILFLLLLSFLIIVDLCVLAWETETIHQSKKYLIPIIQYINFIKYWRLKLQYDNWFYRMTYGKKSGPTVFILGHVTYDTVLNVSAKFNSKFFGKFTKKIFLYSI